MKLGFRIHTGTGVEVVSPQKIQELSKFYELDTLVPGRYSSLFVLNLYILDQFDGIHWGQVIDEIKHLEGVGPEQQTKPPTEFKGDTLKGLWHKHFLPTLPSSIVHNISNHLGKNGLENLVNEVFAPEKGPVLTPQMIDEFVHRLVEGSINDRGAAGKLTGEWIIFAKEQGQNYYLSISSHGSGDENIAANLKQCVHDFPFVSKYVP